MRKNIPPPSEYRRLQRQKLRLSVLKYCVIAETAFPQDFRRFFKAVGYVFRFVSVGSHSDDLASKLPVTTDDGGTGIGFSQTVMKASCVQYALSQSGHQRPQDLIQNILVTAVGVFSVLIRAVADHIVNMTVNIHF